MGTLLRYRLRALKNTLFRSRSRGLQLVALPLYVFALLWIGRAGRRFFVSMETRSVEIEGSWLALAVVGFITMGFVVSLSGLLGRLFLAKDTELLLAAPLKTGALFGYKLIEGFGSGLLFGFMTLAFFVGYGIAVGAGPLFYAMATIVVMLIMLSMVGIAMFLVLLLARLLPPRRIQALLTVATVPIMIGLVLIFLSSVEVSVEGDGEGRSPDPTSPVLVSDGPPIDVSGVPSRGSGERSPMRPTTTRARACWM